MVIITPVCFTQRMNEPLIALSQIREFGPKMDPTTKKKVFLQV